MSSPTLFDDFFGNQEEENTDILAKKRKKAKDEIKKNSQSFPNTEPVDLFEETIDNDSESLVTDTDVTNQPLESKEKSQELKKDTISSNEISLPNDLNKYEDVPNNEKSEKNKDTVSFLDKQYITEIDYFDRRKIDGIQENAKDNLVDEIAETPSEVVSSPIHKELINSDDIAQKSSDNEEITEQLDTPDTNETAIAGTEVDAHDIDLPDPIEPNIPSIEENNPSSQVIESTNDASIDVPIESLQDENSLPDWQLEDKYYHIGAVAKLFNVNVSHIRFWSNEFALKIRTTKKGTRLFTKEQVELLRKIHYLVKVKKYTIKGAKEQLKKKPKVVEATMTLQEKLESLKSQLITIKEQLSL